LHTITLKREGDNGTGNWGQLLAPDGSFLAYTLEPSAKHPTRPCIFPGSYQLAWTDSPRFKRKMIEVCLVPRVPNAHKPMWKYPNEWRQGIRVHSLNAPSESDGCIGVGKTRLIEKNFIGMSKVALKAFEEYVLGLMKTGEPVWLNVVAVASNPS